MLHPTLHMPVQYGIEDPYSVTLMDSMYITLPTDIDVRLCLITTGHLACSTKFCIQWITLIGVYMLCSAMISVKSKGIAY